MLLRSVSRTSPSQRASSDGSLTDGLKKRWLTARISTETRDSPTSPSAAPKPVMLRIMAGKLIPELPSHAVEVCLTRHQETRHLLVSLAEHVAELPRDDGVHDAKLE